MPVQAAYDTLTDPPRVVASPFELAARRLAEAWLDSGRITVTDDDVRLAADFLKRFGITLDASSGDGVRLTSTRGDVSTVSREEAVVTAFRCLAAASGQRSTSRLVPRAA
jgi:hypothetical protein